MYSRRVRQLLLVVTFLVIPALFLRANSKSVQDLNPFERWMLRVAAPVQSGLSRAAWAIHDLGSNYFVLVGVKKENQALLKENEALKAQIHSSRLDSERAERLEQLLKMKNDLKAESIPARVIARDSFPLLGRTIQIRFDNDSTLVKSGMPVVAAGGIVGKILNTYADSYATVQLLVDANFSVPVFLPKSKTFGILRGTGDDLKMVIDFVSAKDEVSINDLVLTTGTGTRSSAPGFSREVIPSIFPAQQFAGNVSHIVKSLSGLDQRLQVIPAVSIRELREVLILLVSPPPQDPSAQSQRAGNR